MSILNFSDFSRINESEDHYNIPGVISTDEGGYEFHVCDSTSGGADDDKIVVSKINGNSICLTYLKDDGEDADSLWIPLDAMDIQKDSDNKITKIVLSPYNRWFSDPSNSVKVDDFIESFADSIETTKMRQDPSMGDFAKDDVEMVLDILDLPLKVAEFSKTDDNTWEAVLDNGSLIEIKKRSKDDLMGSFKIYTNKSDYLPSIFIKNNSGKKSTTFNLGDAEIPEMEEEIGFSDLKNGSPYHKYLIKKCFGIGSEGDKDNLVNYFKDVVGTHSNDYKNSEDANIKKSGEQKSEYIKRMAKVLTTFLPFNDVQEMSRVELK
jgi:hypothetical protein